MVGEFVGTFLFLFFAFAGTMAAKSASLPYQPGNYQLPNSTLLFAPETDPKTFLPSPELLLYVALCFGFSLGVNVFAFYRISGGASKLIPQTPYIASSLNSS